jgi:branched-chain amino acid transport system permease protein
MSGGEFVVLASALLSLTFWQFVVITAGVYAIFALGLQLQYGFTGLLNFGHIAFMAIGSYTMALLINKTHLAFVLNLGFGHLSVPATVSAALIAIVVTMAFGLLVGLPAIRLRADYLAITTIAFGEILRIFILNQDFTGGPLGTYGYGREFLGFSDTVTARAHSVGIELGRDRVLLILVWLAAGLLTLFLWRVVRSPWGRVLRAIREDEDAANALGKNPIAYKLQVMALGSGIAAIAGLFFSFQILILNPSSFEPLFTFFAWVIVLLGGTGSLRGVPVGALVFAFIFAGTRFFGFWPFSLLQAPDRAAVRLILIGLILIAIMAFRPQGIFGKREELLLDR